MLYRYKEHKPSIDPSCFIAPTAVVIGQVEMKARSSIWFNTVARGDINRITLGEDTNVQDNCVLHVTDELAVVLEDRITVGHSVVLHGCRVDSDCLIGMGAVILDGANIGHSSVIAAGSVIAPGTEISPYSLVMGTPGKIVRHITDEERHRFSRNWQSYVRYANEYRDPALFEALES